MTKLLLAGGLLFSASAFSQTTLFQDDFEAGGGNWTLNGGSGNNQWIVNNTYVGDDFGIVANTPSQPGGVTGGPESYYLHIYNTDLCSVLNGCNANFDTGSASDQKAQLTGTIATAGYGSVTLSFWYLCAGLSGSSFGTVEYSTDNGTSWTSAGASYSGVSTWTQASLSLPAWSNQASLKFRFRWQNGGSGLDPAFSVDEVLVTGMSGSFASITTNGVVPGTWCFNTAANITVGFTATGTVNSGNVYTAQLSNAAGSFASPVTIGSLTSSATGTLTLNATIPAGTPTGSGYRIRVTASDPATTGTDNGTNLSVSALPVITIIGNPADGTMCAGESVTLLASGAVNYMWSPSASLSSSTQAQTIATPAITTQYTATGTDANGCVNSGNFTVTVQSCLGIGENEQLALTLYPNPASESIFLQYDGAVVNIREIALLDHSGRIIALPDPQSSVIATAHLAPGTYFVRITHQNGSTTARFVHR